MSQHPSLRSKGKETKFRSVLKRFERLRHLIDKQNWSEDMSIFGIPKIKMLKFKIKKEKAAPEEAKVETAGAEASPAGTTPTTPPKTAVPPKIATPSKTPEAGKDKKDKK